MTAAGRTLLAILLLAALHAASAALTRPLFQVSDEVNYFASVQRTALGRGLDEATQRCVGQPSELIAGGRRLFHEIGATALVASCRLGAGDAAPVLLRLLFGLTLVVVSWCGWQAGSLLTGDPLVAAITALSLATQPVLAKYAGAVTPDSLANASAALSILFALRWLVLGPSALRLLAIVGTTGAALGLKETAHFLLLVQPLVLASALLPSGHGSAAMRVLLGVAGLSAVALLAAHSSTSYVIGPGVTRALAAPASFLGEVVADTLVRLPVFLGSAYWSLGGFGGTSAALPPTAAAVALVSWGAAAFGLARAWLRASVLPTTVLTYLAALGLACLVQAPTRQVLVGMTDQHQGRWLFPVAVPVALALGTGLARAGGVRSWPLVTVGSLVVMLSALLAVIQWHVTSPGWTLDVPHLYLHATGGLDIGVARTADQVTRAWEATYPPGPAMFTLLCCTICGALLLRRHPRPDARHHVHAADHR